MKGQSSLEQLIVIGAALAFIAIAFYLAANYSADSTRISQAQDAVGRLAAAADYVYALGPNSKEYVTVYLPEELAGWNITGKVIVTKIYTSAGTTDVSAYSKADLVGTLPGYRGKQRILVEYLPSGKVRIGEAGLACEPSTISRAFNAGDSGSDTITVGNTATYNVTGIAATISGGSGMVSISLQPPTSLAPGGSGAMSVSYSVPADKASGAYGATVTVDSDNGGSCTTQITISVNGATTCATQCAALAYQSGSCRAAPSDCISSGEDYHPENDGSCSGTPSTPRCCCYPSTDAQGPLVTAVSSTSNATTATNVSINATCDDTGRGNNYIASAQINLDFAGWAAASPSSGTFSTAVVQNVYRQAGQLVGGQHIAMVQCTDTANNTGPIAYHYFNVSMADVLGPLITAMNHSDPAPTTLADITEYCTASEAYTGNADIQSCYVRVDNGLWQAATPVDGAFDSPVEECSYHVGMLTSGMHTIAAYCTDSLGNTGGIQNDTFGVSAGDIMIIMDKSGSMSESVTNAYNNNAYSTSNSGFTLLKSVTVNVKNGDLANVSAEIRSGTSGCAAAFEARVNGTVIAAGNTTSTSYTTVRKNTTLADYATPFTVDLYMKKIYGSSCTVYNRNFAVTQQPTKMRAAQDAAKTFVDIMANSTQAGLVSYSTSATTDKQLAMMDSAANKSALKNSIDALTPSGSTCIGCGIQNGKSELISARSRYPNAVRVEVLLTDGQNNVEPPTTTDASADARNNYATIYTIGFGDSVDPVELTNIALLTGGKYYYAPDAATLTCIFQHIGEPVPPC